MSFAMMPFALKNGTNEVVGVDDVPRGGKCDCHCICCGTPVVARQGDINVHCFAHSTALKEDTDIVCNYSPETAVALILRQELINRSELVLFDHDLGFAYSVNISRWELNHRTEFSTVDMMAETDFGHRIALDIPYPGRHADTADFGKLDVELICRIIPKTLTEQVHDWKNSIKAESVVDELFRNPNLIEPIGIEPPAMPKEIQSPVLVRHPKIERPTEKAPPRLLVKEPPPPEPESRIQYKEGKCVLCGNPLSYTFKPAFCVKCKEQFVGPRFNNLTDFAKALERGWRPEDDKRREPEPAAVDVHPPQEEPLIPVRAYDYKKWKG
ncbi:hypothetical protein NF212_14995 [Parasalinivibrio latis]|uniref:hypothetical protein n=1 Tax=Parasalinivibrio latis TaxID=2952610 RepID=UPI0030DE7509